jgi:hypothetical protein
VKPDVPEALADLVMRSLQKDPGARFQSAAEFLDALIDCEQMGAAPVTRVASEPPQATHSMTEPISYDTRIAPGATPAPIQRQMAAQVIEPAPIDHRPAPAFGRQPRRTGLLVAGVFGAMLVVAGVAFVMLKPGDSSPSATAIGSTPTPSSTPILGASTPAPDATPIGAATLTPADTQDDERLKKAREAEANERYYDAILLYGQYLVDHALDRDPAVEKIRTHQTRLNEFYSLINLGESRTITGDYAAAERDYTEALKLRPDSRLAQAGLKKAQSHRGRTK